jgi:hypothetical protein
MPKATVTTAKLVALVKAAAEEAADHQERFAATDTESRKIVDIMERFLRSRGRVVYGGAAINAHLSPERRFYDPNLYLPDYDFMTPDPLQDCADLVVAFQEEGFYDVEAKFGIHEGTYKIFVNFRPAADITYMPSEIYDRVVADADTIDGIRYASVNFLRMNIYLELSRPAGDVSRWEKIYKRLLLLNEEEPKLKAGHCTAKPLAALATAATEPMKATDYVLHDRVVGLGISNGAVFLSGLHYLDDPTSNPPADEIVLMITDKYAELGTDLRTLNLVGKEYDAVGELLPRRTEFHARRAPQRLVAVVFEAVACHSYTILTHPVGYRLGSLDLLIQMYYGMYFVDLQGYVPVRLLCVIQELIEMEAKRRATAAADPDSVAPHDVFPLECVGHQPSLPELKKAHRKRVLEKRKELVGALRLHQSSGSVRVRVTKKRGAWSRRNKSPRRRKGNVTFAQ